MKSVDLLKGYQPAVEYLGEPIEAGVELRDSYTAVSQLDAQVKESYLIREKYFSK